MKFIEIIGLIVGITVTIHFIPKVIKIIKLKSTKDIYLAMYLVMFTVVMLWFKL
jgi:uncharacterized protein with PQ loop repeat